MVTAVLFDPSDPSPQAGHAPLRGHREVVLASAEALLALGAFGGVVGLISGVIDLGDAVEDLPFGSPVLGGDGLAAVCGALPTLVAAGAWKRSPWAPVGHVVVGGALFGWIVVQGEKARRRRVRLVQRWVLNPPIKVATWFGLVPGLVLIETFGRVSGRRRRSVVGMRLDGDVGWVVAEQGRHAGYVRNLDADPRVRVRVRRRWREATAVVVDGDDPHARLDTFAMERHAAAVRRFGTDLLTVRVDFAHEGGRGRPSSG